MDKQREALLVEESSGTHAHKCSALSSSGNQRKLIETVHFETQFATAVFSVSASLINSALTTPAEH